MTPDAITFRFPDGGWEYGVSEHAPRVGDTVVRLGKTWIVVAVSPSRGDRRVVNLELAADVVDHDRPPPETQP